MMYARCKKGVAGLDAGRVYVSFSPGFNAIDRDIFSIIRDDGMPLTGLNPDDFVFMK
jgi:hypothetical protein